MSKKDYVLVLVVHAKHEVKKRTMVLMLFSAMILRAWSYALLSKTGCSPLGPTAWIIPV